MLNAVAKTIVHFAKRLQHSTACLWTKNILLKLINEWPKQGRMPGQNMLVKWNLHLHGTFKDYLNYKKSPPVIQRGGEDKQQR